MLQTKIEGIVERGRAIGRTLGFPTANVRSDQSIGLAFGVYLAIVHIDRGAFYALVSIGVRPTFESGGEIKVEAFLLDFDGDIYGEHITLTVLKYIRGEYRFSSAEHLRLQMLRDVELAKTLIKSINIMSKSLKGTRTEKNLLAAFAGESQARNRYNFFASQARKEGYEVIAKFFDETAENERQHGKQFFKFLEGGMIEIVASYPAGMIGTTAENLLAGAEGEYEEWSTLYPEFAAVAKEEGFSAVAAKFTMIATIEKEHEARYRALLETVEAKTVFKKAEKQVWRCRECGYEHVGTDALDMCPVCDHAQAFQEIKCDKF